MSLIVVQIVTKRLMCSSLESQKYKLIIHRMQSIETIGLFIMILQKKYALGKRKYSHPAQQHSL